MKASRAPGPVSYMQRHVSRANGEAGKKAKDAEGGGRPAAKKGAVAEGGGGVLKKFKDLDNIPDFSWGDAEAFSFSGDHNGNSAHQSRHIYNQGYDEEDEYIDDSQAQGWTSPRASPPKATSFAVKEPLYHTKSAGGGVSPRFGGGRTNAIAQHSQGPKSAPSKLVATHDSDDEEDNFDNIPDVYDTPPKKPQYSPRKESVSTKPAMAAKAPPPLPFQKQQQEQQQQQKAQRSAVTGVGKAAPAGQPSSSSAKPTAAAPAGAAGAKAAGRQPAAAAPQPLRVSISESVNTQYAPQSPPPPLPCERPLNQPKDQSPKSPSHLTDQDRLFYTKQPRHVEFKPYTLQQYKMIKPKEYVELGKLKPDLNTDELIAKRKNLDRIKEFSKQLRQVNADMLTQQPKLPSASEQNDLQIARNKYESTRQRALEFAKNNVPKPKVARNAQLDDRRDPRGYYDEETDNGPSQLRDATRRSQSAGERSGSYGGSRSNLGIPMDEDAFQAAKLQELEAKHQQSKARMEAIKRSLHGV